MEIDIYTDCGGSILDYGIGIHIIDQSEKEDSYILKTDINKINSQFETKLTGSTGVGEMFAILTSLNLIPNDVKKVRIYTDSDHAFNVFNGLGNRKKNASYSKFVKMVQDFTSKFEIEIEIMWIKGHIDVYGNHIADRLSNKALKKSIQKYELLKVEIPKPGIPVKII